MSITFNTHPRALMLHPLPKHPCLVIPLLFPFVSYLILPSRRGGGGVGLGGDACVALSGTYLQEEKNALIYKSRESCL